VGEDCVPLANKGGKRGVGPIGLAVGRGDVGPICPTQFGCHSMTINTV
jgi:hypothetical protein